MTVSTRAAAVNTQSLADYIFNWLLWTEASSKLIDCTWLGLYGLFWFNDNGVIAEKCFQTGLVGGRANFEGLIKANYKEKVNFFKKYYQNGKFIPESDKKTKV